MLPAPQLLNKVANFIQAKGKYSYYCLFLLGEKVGLRVSEAVNFNLSLKQKQNLYLIKGKHHKKRHVFVDPQVISELQKNSWRPLQTNRFSYAHFLQKVKKELEIPANIELTPHTLRRCFATYQANSGMPLPVLQQVLGHATIKTTSLYWKSTETPWEKLFTDKWLAGKIPQEPPKTQENNDILVIKNNWEIFVNIHQETNIFIPNNPLNSEQKLLTAENKNLQEKNQVLTQELAKRDKTITELKNNLEKAEVLLKQTQKEKEILLKLLSIDLQNQYENLKNKNRNNQELHQQLVAQIEISLKN